SSSILDSTHDPHSFPTRRSSDLELAIGAVVAIERQRKAIGRLNRHDHGAGAVSRFVRNEPCLDTLALEELQDEVAHLVVADRRQDRKSTRLNSKSPDHLVCRLLL